MRTTQPLKERGSQAKVRLPNDLKEWLHREADASLRSLNAEIVLRLQRSREEQQRSPALA